MSLSLPTPADTSGTRDHIDRMVSRRDLLDQAICDSFDQMVAHISRHDWTPAESVAWIDWARSLGVKFAYKRTLDALRVSEYEIRAWRQNPPDRRPVAGTFPLNYQSSGRKGEFCVYLLMDAQKAVMYVGRTRSIRTRLKSHWNSDKRPYIVYWEVIVCSGYAEMAQLEADLIFQHQPPLNRAARSRRHYTGSSL